MHFFAKTAESQGPVKADLGDHNPCLQGSSRPGSLGPRASVSRTETPGQGPSRRSANRTATSRPQGLREERLLACPQAPRWARLSRAPPRF